MEKADLNVKTGRKVRAFACHTGSSNHHRWQLIVDNNYIAINQSAIVRLLSSTLGTALDG